MKVPKLYKTQAYKMGRLHGRLEILCRASHGDLATVEKLTMLAGNMELPPALILIEAQQRVKLDQIEELNAWLAEQKLSLSDLDWLRVDIEIDNERDNEEG